MVHKIALGLITVVAASTLAFTSKIKHNTVYTVDTKATTATWIGKKIKGEHTGAITISKGSIITNHGNIIGGTVEFDMNSITNTDITNTKSNEKLVHHLKSDDFFGVEKFPTATIEITSVTLKSGNDYNVTGKLTIKGITNDISFPALIKMDATTMVTIAKVIVNRTKYDIKYNSASIFSGIGDKAISDEFELNVNVVAKAAN